LCGEPLDQVVAVGLVLRIERVAVQVEERAREKVNTLFIRSYINHGMHVFDRLKINYLNMHS